MTLNPAPILILFLSTLHALVLMAADSPPAQKGAPTNTWGWLLLPEKKLLLEINQKNLDEGNKGDSGEFVAKVIKEIVQADYTIFLARSFVSAEQQFYATAFARKVTDKTYGQLAEALDGSLKSGELKWNEMQSLLVRRDKSPGSLGGYRPQTRPWAWVETPTDRIRLAPTNAGDLPKLTIQLTWESGGGYRSAAQAPGVSTTLWAPHGTFTLSIDGKARYERTFDKHSFQSSYRGPTETPAVTGVNAMYSEIYRGLREKPVRIQ